MKRSVTFQMEGWNAPITGYEGGGLPIDKAAETVLSSTEKPVTSIVFHFDGGVRNVFNVLHSNDEEIGAPCQHMHQASWERDRGPRCLISGMLIGAQHGHTKCPLHRNDILAASR